MQEKLTKKELCRIYDGVNMFYNELYMNTCSRDEFLKYYNERKEIIRKLERLVEIIKLEKTNIEYNIILIDNVHEEPNDMIIVELDRQEVDGALKIRDYINTYTKYALIISKVED